LAAAQDKVEGISSLARLYKAGQGCEVDLVKSFSLYSRAAELGDMMSQHNSAGMYILGMGVKKDEAKAIYWYKRSAEKGNRYAMEILAKFYRYGKAGCKVDVNEAEKWDRLAYGTSKDIANLEMIGPGISASLDGF
jgi:TPR repeat protein